MCLRLILRISGVAFLRREIFTSDQFNSSFPLLCFCNKWKRAKRECWKKVWNWKWRFPSRFQSESERRWGDRRRPNKNPTDSSDRKMLLSKLLGVRMRRTVMVAEIILMRKLSLGINIFLSNGLNSCGPGPTSGVRCKWCPRAPIRHGLLFF